MKSGITDFLTMTQLISNNYYELGIWGFSDDLCVQKYLSRNLRIVVEYWKNSEIFVD